MFDARPVAAIAAMSAVLAGCASPGAPKDPALAARAEARATIQKADLLSQMTFWAQEHAANPDDLDAARGFVDALRRAGRHDRAVEIALRALERSPDDPVLTRQAGLSLLAQGRGGDAIGAFQLLSRLNPQDVSAFVGLGLAYDQANRHQAAQAAYQGALAIAPDHAVALTNLGVSHLIGGDLERARDTLERAVGAPNAPAAARQNLAVVYALLGRWGDAETLARVDLPPEVAAANLEYLRGLRGDVRRWSDLRPGDG